MGSASSQASGCTRACSRLAGKGVAELALAPADRVAPLPGQVSFAEAAGLVIGGGTA